MPEIKAPEANTVIAPQQSNQATSDPGEVHGIDLLGYAKLMAQLASGQPRQKVLGGAGLDDAQWQTVEKTWGLRLAAAAQRMDTETLLGFERAVAAAQRDCEAPAPSRTMSEYAKVVAALERGTTPVEICAEHGMTLSEFFALQQAYTRRITSNPEEAETFKALLEAAQ